MSKSPKSWPAALRLAWLRHGFTSTSGSCARSLASPGRGDAGAASVRGHAEENDQVSRRLTARFAKSGAGTGEVGDRFEFGFDEEGADETSHIELDSHRAVLPGGSR
jgi:hypothetical protein